MTEEVHTINIQEGGQWKTIIPHMAEAAVKDGTGQTITLTYATKSEVQRALADGSVTKLGKITVGAPNIPVYLLDGNPTACKTMVTIDEAQTITGHKKIVQSGTTGVPFEAERKGNGAGVSITQTDQNMGTSGIQYYPGMYIYDSNGNRVGGWYPVKETDNRTTVRMRHNSTSGATRELIVDGDFVSSSSLVSKGYVESTDGVTNNLVHRSADESITGVKDFAIPTLSHKVSIVGGGGWRKIYIEDNKATVTHTHVIDIIADGEKYARIVTRHRGGTRPTGEYVFKVSDWTAEMRITRDADDQFTLWINDARHLASVVMSKVSNNAFLYDTLRIPEDPTEIYDEPTVSQYAHVTVIQ